MYLGVYLCTCILADDCVLNLTQCEQFSNHALLIIASQGTGIQAPAHEAINKIASTSPCPWTSPA